MSDEFDIPVFQSADQIRRREFVTSRRGYDPEQVRNYLEQLAEQVQDMDQMLRAARIKVEAATGPIPKVDPYAEVASRVAEAIRVADESAQQLLANAKQKAEALLADAKTAADRIRAEAQATADSALLQAETTVHDARVRAADAVAALVERRGVILERLDGMRDRLETAAGAIRAVLEAKEDADLPPLPAPEPPLVAAPSARDAGAAADTTVLDPAYADLWTEDGGDTGTPPPDALDDLPVMPAVDLSWGDDAEGPKGT